ncbi:MAG: UDP-N-acetylmuramoylalanine--D-glutamate ligase [Oceanicoccus sp.]|jgi:UDP-N-acetylmuramoylalanine--D-glutamate ligase
MQLIARDNRQIVVGLGITGLSCVRYLSRKKLPFSVVDSREHPPGLEQLEAEFPLVAVSVGELDEHSFVGANRLVVSPGVALDEPAIAKAKADGAAICGDIDLFRAEAKAPIVAITGSNGKSTVTTLLAEMAAKAGLDVAVGGNLGTPALDLLPADDQPEPDLYVLELSSFQLERAGVLDFAVSTVLNISADHMDRYPNLLAYHQAKHRIFRGCKKAVVNRADPLSQPLLAEGVSTISFGLNQPDFNAFGLLQQQGVEYLAFETKRLMPVSELKIAGRHNIENALAALALGHSVGLAMDAMLAVLAEFAGLAHRCQFVSEQAGVRFYNDSKGTNVGAAIASIEGLASDGVELVLIAGGDAKGADFAPLLPVVAKHCRAVVLLGEAAEQLQSLFAGQLPAVMVDTMEQAVQQATDLAQTGDAVLLSPACASFDMFDNYQQRGDVFSQAVTEQAMGGLS